MREGHKGAKYFYYVLFTHNCFNWEKWLHELLGEGHVVLDFQVNISTHLWVVLGFTHCSLFTLFHSLLVIYHSSFISCSWDMGVKLWGRCNCLLAIVMTCVFQPWISACMYEMHYYELSFVHSCESWESQHEDSWLDALELWKDVESLRYHVAEKGFHSLGLCRLERRELV
jgi:hypothetical protein